MFVPDLRGRDPKVCDCSHGAMRMPYEEENDEKQYGDREQQDNTQWYRYCRAAL